MSDEIQPISGKTNQPMFNDLWWQISHDEGRTATKKMVKDAVREVMLEAGVLDAQALAYLKRPVNLIDPTGKTSDIVGTTTPAKKFNWMAHNDAQLLNAILAIGEALGLKLDIIIDAVDEDDEDTAPAPIQVEAGPTSPPIVIEAGPING